MAEAFTKIIGPITMLLGVGGVILVLSKDMYERKQVKVFPETPSIWVETLRYDSMLGGSLRKYIYACAMFFLLSQVVFLLCWFGVEGSVAKLGFFVTANDFEKLFEYMFVLTSSLVSGLVFGLCTVRQIGKI